MLFFEQESLESSGEEEGAKLAEPASGKRGAEIKNMPFDEALAYLDASQAAGEAKKDREVKNMPFDEALEVSASMSQASGAQPQVMPSCCLLLAPTRLPSHTRLSSGISQEQAI